MAVTYDIRDSVAVIRLDEPELITGVEDRFRNILNIIVLKRIDRVVLDVTGVDFMDSSFLAALMGIYKDLERCSGHLAFVGVGEELRKIFEIMRLDAFFTVFDSQDEAVAAIRKETPPE